MVKTQEVIVVTCLGLAMSGIQIVNASPDTRAKSASVGNLCFELITFLYPNNNLYKVRMAEWSKAPDSSSGPRLRAWVQIPLSDTAVLLSSLFFVCE